MMLAGHDEAAVRSLIDRGVAADSSFPRATPLLMSTSDRARNVRAAYFEQTAKELEGVFPIEVLAADTIAARGGCAVFLHGSRQRSGIETLRLRRAPLPTI